MASRRRFRAVVLRRKRTSARRSQHGSPLSSPTTAPTPASSSSSGARSIDLQVCVRGGPTRQGEQALIEIALANHGVAYQCGCSAAIGCRSRRRRRVARGRHLGGKDARQRRGHGPAAASLPHGGTAVDVAVAQSGRSQTDANASVTRDQAPFHAAKRLGSRCYPRRRAALR